MKACHRLIGTFLMIQVTITSPLQAGCGHSQPKEEENETQGPAAQRRTSQKDPKGKRSGCSAASLDAALAELAASYYSDPEFYDSHPHYHRYAERQKSKRDYKTKKANEACKDYKLGANIFHN